MSKGGKPVTETPLSPILQENVVQSNNVIAAPNKTKNSTCGNTVVDGTPKSVKRSRPHVLAVDTSVRRRTQSPGIILAGTSRTPIRSPRFHVSRTSIRTPLRTPNRTPRLHRLSYRLAIAKQGQKSPYHSRSRRQRRACREKTVDEASRPRYNLRLRGAGGKKSRSAQVLNEDLNNCMGEDAQKARLGAVFDQYFIEALP